MSNAMTEFNLLRTAASCLAAIPADRRAIILVELLRLLGLERNSLRQLVDSDEVWAAPRLVEPPPKPVVEPKPPRREVVGTIFHGQFR
jgi:hypothetical protein